MGEDDDGRELLLAVGPLGAAEHRLEGEHLGVLDGRALLARHLNPECVPQDGGGRGVDRARLGGEERDLSEEGRRRKRREEGFVKGQ